MSNENKTAQYDAQLKAIAVVREACETRAAQNTGGGD